MQIGSFARSVHAARTALVQATRGLDNLLYLNSPRPSLQKIKEIVPAPQPGSRCTLTEFRAAILASGEASRYLSAVQTCVSASAACADCLAVWRDYIEEIDFQRRHKSRERLIGIQQFGARLQQFEHCR